MNLFLRARYGDKGPLTNEEEEQLAESGDQPIERFWFRRYGRFLKDNHPEAFARFKRIYSPSLLDSVLRGRSLDETDNLGRLDDEASRWQ
jgi:hypothetical protein